MVTSRKIIFGAALQGIAIFIGLGLAGYGNDTIAVALGSIGVDAEIAHRLSRMVFGLFSAGATFLIVSGYLDERDGVSVINPAG
ncbi:hypothetical protein [Marinobacterium aestuariivivens]|uniref:Uncharacterized protein n=1 Tax=Marinobacterium aestuariivivens TaxID=1698799 RepID=A0ABW2AA32_9GAMM